MTQDEGTRAHVLPQSLSGSSYFGHRAWARQQARFRLQWKLRAGGADRRVSGRVFAMR